MAKEAKVRITAQDKTKAAIKSAKSNLNSLKRTANAIAPAIAGVLSLRLGGAILKVASDAQEARSKFEAVFGDKSGGISEQIKKLSETIPLATHEFEGMTSEIQDLLVPMGVASDAAATMSVDITKLAADLASFNNIPIQEALERIRSGLVGQYEPLLKFGVALNATTVKAKALEMGIGDGKRMLTASERAIVSYRMILETTTAAQGDAAATAGSLANQWKFVQANAKNLGVSVGSELLPTFTTLLSKTNSMSDAAMGLASAVKILFQSFTSLITVGQAFFTVIFGGVQQLAWMSKMLVDMVQTVFQPVIKGFEAMGAAAAAAFYAMKHPLSAKDGWDAARPYIDAFKESVTGMPDALKESFDKMVENTAGTYDIVIDELAAKIGDLKNLWSTDGTVNSQEFKTWAEEQRDQAVTAYSAAFEEILAKWKEFKGKMGETSDTVTAAASTAAANMKKLALGVREGLINAAAEGKTAFADLQQYVIASIQRMLAEWILFKSFTAMGGAIGGPVGGMLSAFGGGFKNMGTGGNAYAGRSYLVGDRGPEILTMGGSGGTITPNSQIGGSSGPTIYADMRGASVEAVKRLERWAKERDGTVEHRAIHAVRDMMHRNPAAFGRA